MLDIRNSEDSIGVYKLFMNNRANKGWRFKLNEIINSLF